MKKIGILALQGAFAEHAHMLTALGANWFEIRQSQDLNHGLDGLILPGGESTVMTRLLHEMALFKPIEQKINSGMPVLGTCAGLILLAKQVEGGTPCLATMDIAVRRNAYGRQLGSFTTEDTVKGLGTVPMTFIRAPYILKAGPDVEGLAEVGGHIVAARQGRQLVTAFHPELTNSTVIHSLFLNMVS